MHLLLYFTENYGILYQINQHISNNVHNLIHLCNYVKLWGPLDEFKYKNYKKIKKRIRSLNWPLKQLIHRYIEDDNLDLVRKKKNYPIPHFSNISNANDKRIIKSIQCKDFYINI